MIEGWLFMYFSILYEYMCVMLGYKANELQYFICMCMCVFRYTFMCIYKSGADIYYIYNMHTYIICKFLYTRLCVYQCVCLCVCIQYEHWTIHVYEQYVCVLVKLPHHKRTCLMSLSVADIRPCFRKHVFHLYGLLSPSCFLPWLKKCWTYSSSSTSPAIPGKGQLPTLPPSCLVAVPQQPWPSPRWQATWI